METLKLENVCKVYEGAKLRDDDVLAVSNFNLTVEDNEFIVFVGPSGCGKSTTLRMIAGLEDITSGNLYIDGQLMNKVEANYRNIAMVFQNYALYPHMTAYKIMAFGLKNRHVPKAEIDRRIKEAAKILDIEDLLKRKPKAMSGGQRQRVALGRAIVQTPKIFLLDEPLSNLDAKLRAQMRVEINKLYEKLKTTFVYVTHDQVEAMTMGTRIVVMKKGFVQQIDTPATLFDYPKNRFVAGFLGTPQMNFYECEITRTDNDTLKIVFHGHELNYKLHELREIDQNYLDFETHKAILGIRPDDLVLNDKNGFDAKVNIVESLGTESLIYGDFDVESEAGIHESETSLILKTTARTDLRTGDLIKVGFNSKKIHLFADEKGERSIMLTPRTKRTEIRGYMELKDDGYKFTFDNMANFTVNFNKEVNEIYKNGLHRVKVNFKNGLKLDPKGNISLIYRGEGLLDGKLTKRFDINVEGDETKSFEDSLTHIYLVSNKKFKIGEIVKASLNEEDIAIEGDDKVSIFDLTEKVEEIDEYNLTEYVPPVEKKKLKTLKQIMREQIKKYRANKKAKKELEEASKAEELSNENSNKKPEEKIEESDPKVNLEKTTTDTLDDNK